MPPDIRDLPMRCLCRTESEEQTEALGAIIAGELRPGMVLGLIGPLGAGKTRLVQAICETMGIERDMVNSPTFVLIQEYSGRIPVYHFDTYRVGDLEEFLDLGTEELLAGDGVCLIEWANRFPEVMPTDTLWIEIRLLSPTSREWEFRGTGTAPESLLRHLANTWDSAQITEA